MGPMADVCDCGAPLTIGAAARHLDVTVETLRYYESAGLVHPERRGAHRVYSQRDMDALHVVRAMRAVGFSMAEVAELLAQKTDDPPEVLIARVRRLLAEYRGRLEQRRRDLDRADDLLRGWLDELDSVDVDTRGGEQGVTGEQSVPASC